MDAYYQMSKPNKLEVEDISMLNPSIEQRARTNLAYMKGYITILLDSPVSEVLRFNGK